MWEAQPSAVAAARQPLDAGSVQRPAELQPNHRPVSVPEQHDRADQGHNYDSTGDVLGQGVQQGQSGSLVAVSASTYITNTDSAGNTISLPATESVYPVAGDTSIANTTSFAYPFYAGTNQVQQKTKTLPVAAPSRTARE